MAIDYGNANIIVDETSGLRSQSVDIKYSDLNTLINEANDLVKTYTYLDAWAADERVSTVVYSSASLALTVTETFTYAWTAGSYRVSTITRTTS